ncbi:hypothetical protein KY290_030955 [Solanum tuberosum]|uniref:Uncharacterized protein n=1 Tax=Solanum tuberosum TaxID=4113 RepID=A0ABQ7U7S8_SOLTU|nr:hypothetical protein KY290_030955 [Solanum tuberosum]
MVESHTKERNRRRRRDLHVPAEEPTSTPQHIGSSETESEDIDRAVAKRTKEAENEWVKTKGDPKSVKKSHVKRDKVTKKAHSKPKSSKGPSTFRSKLREGKSLRIILGVPSLGIRSIEGCKPFSDFVQRATKRGDIKHAGLPKKFLRGEYQLLFEFINKVLVPRSEKRTVASAADLFHMEQLDELEAITGGVPGTVKHMFSPATLLEFECAKGKVKGKSHVSDLLEQQESLKRELNDLTVNLNANELLKTNASLSEEVQALNKKLLQAHGPGPLQSVLVQDNVLYNWKVVVSEIENSSFNKTTRDLIDWRFAS